MNLEPEVLIITNLDDFAADYLILKFIDSNINYLRVNSEDISKWIILYNPQTGISLTINEKVYRLNSIKGVYFRRAPTVFKHFDNKENKNYLVRECRDFFEGLYLTLTAKWINPIFSDFGARPLFFPSESFEL